MKDYCFQINDKRKENTPKAQLKIPKDPIPKNVHRIFFNALITQKIHIIDNHQLK